MRSGLRPTNCDGLGVDQDKHADSTKEYQSAAAVEGFADTLSAWAWHDVNESDCTYNRHYVSDWDLDLDANEPGSDLVNCDGIPNTGLASYVTARDWLADVAFGPDPAGCTGTTLNNHGSQYDWLRYGWDMLSDESVPVKHFVDLYDNANPQSWDADGSTGTTDDDPIVRWEAAADGYSPSYATAHDNQRTNGQDH